ncbi:MAG: peptidoglycan-binding protein [Gemmataceae bacterium]
MPLTSPRFKDNDRLQKAAANNPALRRGHQGEHVRLIQQGLIDLGYPMPISTKRYDSPDGIYGEETAAKIKEFQKDHELTPDGVAGKNTMAKLDELLRTPGQPLPPLPNGGFALTHKVVLHFRSCAMPVVSEFNALNHAKMVYGPHGIDVVFGSGMSLLLGPDDALKLDVVRTSCAWDQANDELELLHSLGGMQGVGAKDVRVFYVNVLEDSSDDSGLNGCAGHVPGKAAVAVAAGGTRWTLAHELGHVLLSSKFDPVHMDDDTTNIMHAPTSDITAALPTFTPEQVIQMKKSPYCQLM